jgi:hypothetical protein
VGDHAYWLSGLAARDGKAVGTIDARSEAFGVGDPAPTPQSPSGGTLDGGAHGPMPFVRREQTWGDAPATPVADRLVVKATNVGKAVVDARRARLSCAPQLDVTSDGPLDLQIDCAPVKAKRCAKTVALKLPRVKGERNVAVSGTHVRRTRGRNLRRAVVRRPSRKAFTVRIRVRTSGGRMVAVRRRVAGCG